MTNPNDDRLSRTENLVEENARAINNLIEVVTIHQGNIEEAIFFELRDMKSEIRGLQLENRRMLDRFFRDNGNDELQE